MIVLCTYTTTHISVSSHACLIIYLEMMIYHIFMYSTVQPAKKYIIQKSIMGNYISGSNLLRLLELIEWEPLTSIIPHNSRYPSHHQYDNDSTGCSIWIATKLNNCCDYVFESDTFPFRFMLETCVHFDFWNKKFFEFFIGSPLWFGVFFNFFYFSKKWKIPQIIGGPPYEKFEKNFIPKIKMYTYFQHKSEGKSVWLEKHGHNTCLLL